MTCFYLTHPQVEIDPAIPVPQWRLSYTGRVRIEAILSREWLSAIHRIVSSDERKAVETATLIGDALRLAPDIRRGLGENDRSSTGFLAPDAFEAAADQFFARPQES